jgi:hypothetical protein
MEKACSSIWPGTSEVGPWDGGAAVGVDAVARLWGAERQGHPPTARAVLGQIAGAPIAPGTRLLNQDAVWGRGWPLAEQLSEVTRARADGAQQAHGGPVLVGHVGDREGRVVARPADRQGGRVGQGCPPRAGACVRRRWHGLQASSPTLAQEGSRPLGSQYV